MKNVVFLGIFIAMLLIVGCTSQTQYVCSNGSVVSNSNQCQNGVAGGGSSQSILPGQAQSGCSYNNPPCSSDFNCVNNVCVKKDGCLFSNPSCGQGYDCINNQCVMKQGCLYDNPTCDADYKCDNNQCIEKTVCGKFGCQQGESSTNCCVDCGCPTGETCDNNECKSLKPVIDTSNNQKTRYSVTIYLSKPNFNIGTITSINTGNDDAKNVVITLSSKDGYFDNVVLNVGNIQKGDSKQTDYDLSFTQKALDLSNENNELSVDVKTTYANSANQQLSGNDEFTINVYGKNNVVGPYDTWTPNYSPWVTPNQNIVREFAAKSTSGIATYESDESRRLAAKWLFESIRAYGVKYVNERAQVGDYAQFPMETLKRKNGDCEDQAILYATLLEAVGIKSALIGIPGHAYAGFYTLNGTLIPVETTAGNFDDAITIGLSETLTQINARNIEIVSTEDSWNELPQVIHQIEPSIPMMDIKKQVVTNCEDKFDLSKGLYYSSTVRFQNNGNAPGAGCASMLTYQDMAKRSEDYACWTILAGETVDYELVNDYEFGSSTSCDTK